MFKKLLNKNELEVLNNKIITLNKIMLGCAAGNTEACEKVKAQYNNIIEYKNNKMKEIFGDSNMNDNYHSFKTEQLTTGKFIQTPRRMTGFEAVNRFSNCNYAIPSAAANQIPVMVGASNVLDIKAAEIQDLFEEFDRQMGTGVKGVVGKSWRKKVKSKLSFNVEDIKREATKALNPVHALEQFKEVTKKNLQEAADWGKRILKNPAELLHPPLPKTGNKFLDEQIIEKIEELGKKADPAWQIGEQVKKYAVQPVIDKFAPKKEPKMREKEAVNAAYSTWYNKMRSYLDQAFINNPMASEKITSKAYSELERLASDIKREADKNPNSIIEKGWSIMGSKGDGAATIALEWMFKDKFVKIFEDAVREMFIAANIPFSNLTSSVVDNTFVSQQATGGEDQKRFLDLFNKIKSQKNRGLFKGSCGPDSKEIESVAIGNEVYKICEPQKKFKTVIKYKDIRLHQKARRTRGVVGATTADYNTQIQNIAANAEKLKMVRAAVPGVPSIDVYKKAFNNLNPNQGLFFSQCGIHSEPAGSQNIDNQSYQICNVVPATEEIQTVTKKRYVKGVGACPSCIIEDINMLGNSSAADFFRLSGIKFYSGNNMEGKKVTRI